MFSTTRFWSWRRGEASHSGPHEALQSQSDRATKTSFSVCKIKPGSEVSGRAGNHIEPGGRQRGAPLTRHPLDIVDGLAAASGARCGRAQSTDGTELLCRVTRHETKPVTTGYRSITELGRSRSYRCAAQRFRSAVRARWAATQAIRVGSTGSRSRARVSMRDLRCRRAFLWEASLALTGHRAAHGPQRAGSSSAHSARSR